MIQPTRGALLHALAGAAVACTVAVPSLAAAAYPEHPITFIVPFPPAGPSDILARVVAQRLGDVMGQTVVVDNKPGASGGIGMQQAARAAPDGYTIVLGGLPVQILNPALGMKLAYDPDKDFAPITTVAKVQYILVARPNLPANNVPELIRMLKADPEKYTYGTPGVGNTSHITAEMFKHAASVGIRHVPYKGDAPAINDLMAGFIDLVFTLPPGVLQDINSGKLKAIATAAPQRSPILPDLPTFAEQGTQGVEAETWFSILAPAATPSDIVAKLNSDLRKVLTDPDVRKRMASLGAVPAPMSVNEFKTFIGTERTKWDMLVKDSGATVE